MNFQYGDCFMNLRTNDIFCTVSEAPLYSRVPVLPFNDPLQRVLRPEEEGPWIHVGVLVTAETDTPSEERTLPLYARRVLYARDKYDYSTVFNGVRIEFEYKVDWLYNDENVNVPGLTSNYVVRYSKHLQYGL
jgi:hypothetical protein